ncbi:unnamed protein product, partial [marine sediment metagenome]
GDQPTEIQFARVHEIIQLAGLATGTLSLRPEVNVDEIKKQNKPDQVHIGTGAFFGHSMPVYAADNEELYYRQIIPSRWDGTSDVVLHVECGLGDAEDVGDYFKFQLDWAVALNGEPIPTAVNPETVEQIVLAGRAAQYDKYELAFTL